jgi:putative membrane protein
MGPGPAASSGPAEPPAPAAAPLTDEQIAAVTTTANTGEVEQAKVAQKQGKDAKVKAFAAKMIAHHNQANAAQKKITDKAKITPADSDMSKQLAGDSQKLIDSWKDLKGPEFDKAYIDAQVKNHQAVLDAIDQKILPAVKNADLKKDITDFRPKVEAHLKEAQDIQKALEAAPAPAAGGDKKPAGGDKKPPAGGEKKP